MSQDRTNSAARVAAHQRDGRGVQRVAYPIGIREAVVTRRTWVTDRMVRLTFAGAELDGLHTYAADDHVKLLFPDEDGRLDLPVPNENLMLDWPTSSHLRTRAYTIRRYDPAARELDIDFVVHDGGLAADWASTVQLGASVPMAGPPGAQAFPFTYEHYLLVVDSTALPAIARWLEEAPAAARVDVVTMVEHPAQDDYPLSHPSLTVHRLAPDADLVGVLAALVAGDPATSQDTFVFAAGEAELIKPLRAWTKQVGIDSSITGYWRRGVEGFDD